ncbi:MAG: hypothetical protein ACTSVZ_04555 [Promethearchaeota archaeon]
MIYQFSVSELTSMISAILLLLGLVFVVWKIIHKHSQKKGGHSSPKMYTKIEKPLYILHLSASAIGTIVAIVHAITAEPANIACRISGWVVLITTHIMFIMGIIMGLKSKMRPFGSELDAENKQARKIKWILTAIAILALFVHFLMHI